MERSFLLLGGVAFIVVGLVLLLGYFFTPGYLTAVFRPGNVTIYFPIGLSILLSIVLTLVLNLFFRAR